MPEREEVFIEDKKKLLDDIKISLGSYAAERIKIGHTTSGVGGDFRNAYSTAHDMVWRVGMGKSGLIGDFHAITSNYISEETKARLDSDVQDILNTCLKEVDELLKKEEAIIER